MIALFGVEGLVNPALAAGAALAAVPLIIHLLNRRRHVPLDWAAMRFARLAWKKIRRRTRFENLLLLVLRMLAIAFLALALARPFVTGGGSLSSLTENHRDLVLLIDGSASMDYRLSLTRVWDETVERARELIEELDGSSGDRVHLYLCGETARLLSDRTPEDALALLATLENPLAERFNLQVALQRAIADLDERRDADPSAINELVLLSDGQRANFLTTAGSRALNSLNLLSERELTLRVEDIHSRATGRFTPNPSNLSLASLAALDPFESRIHAIGAAPTLRAGGDAGFLVNVRNSGSERRSVRVALEVDGQRKTAKRVEIPPLGELEVRLNINLSEANASSALSGSAGTKDGTFHSIEAVLESDNLPIDDRRSLVVFSPGTIEILVVNGDPRPEISDDEVGYLLAGLTPVGDGLISQAGGAPFLITTHSSDAFTVGIANGSIDLGNYPVVWLANIENPSPGWVSALEDHVAAGATLVISLGDRVTAARYNERLGAGLLPVRLEERIAVASRREAFWTPRIEAPEHPALSFFSDERFEVFFTGVPFFEVFGSVPNEGARVLASLNDQGPGRPGSPLFVERDFGEGRTVIWNSSIDADWNLFAESPASLIPLTHEVCFGAARPAGPSRNLDVGDSLSAEFPFFPEAPTLVRPDGSSLGIASDAEESQGATAGRGSWLLIDIATPDAPGIWSLRTSSGTDDPFAVTLHASEGDLARISSNELMGLHPALVATSEVESEENGGEDNGGELWRGVLLLVLACLVGEALWAGHIEKRTPGVQS